MGIKIATYQLGDRETVCLSHVVLDDYIIHIFSDEMHMGRYVRSYCTICFILAGVLMGVLCFSC